MMKKTNRNLLLILTLFLPLTGWCQHATQSVLREGSWWKIGIKDDGVYKLSVNEFPSMQGKPTANIAMYGYRGGALSMVNGTREYDDLEEIAIEIHDINSNGIMESEDYLLFFATGPDRWEYSNNFGQYIHKHHPYGEYNYVYITFSNGTHRRISTADEGDATGEAVTTCHALVFHEKDLTNTHKSGQIWVGERYHSGNATGTTTLTLPAVPTDAINIRYALASVSSANSSFTVNVNGTTRTHSFVRSSPYTISNGSFTSNGSRNVNFGLTYQYSENMATGYIDFVEVDAVVPMTLSDNMTIMYIPEGDGNIHSHKIVGTSSDTKVWDVTDYNHVTAMACQHNGNMLTFNNTTDKRHEYVAFNLLGTKTTEFIEQVENQNIHGATNPELVIVCHESLKGAAQRLATLHSIHDNMEVLTVTQDEVFNEFSSGQRDPMAIREMMSMFHKRSLSDENLTVPRYLLLMGKGTYDNKNILGLTISTLVTYQDSISFDDDGGSIATDDKLCYLDDGESGTVYDGMDVGVGRIPAKNTDEANIIIDKIERYITRSDLTQSSIRGDWRNSIALLADDADPSCPNDTSFTTSSEATARLINEYYPQFTVDKIYADAYIQQSGADGSYYPDVNNALKKRIDYGCLVLNYIGHGSMQYIGTERYMMKSNISNYTNYNQLPFFITSTCTFGRFDIPDETCGAEEFLLADGAGIACLAASRPISHVQAVNTDIIMQSINPENRIGDAIRIAKNHRPTTQALTLIGDPAVRLNFPEHKIVVTAINGREVESTRADSATVLSTVTVEGEIRDKDGNLVEDFDGIIYPEVYDRVVSTHTLANDNEGCEVMFSQQNSLLYRGHATVSGGRFSYHFIVPRDVAYKYDRAKLCHYAKSTTEDATGAYTNLFLGGFNEDVDLSETRPEIQLYMGDTNFHNGGITDADPTLLVLLYDSIGINAVGSGLGHDITATLDGNPNNILILNELYETDINDEHRGSIRYNMSGLSTGKHTITVKAWNIYNYSNSATITFNVRGETESNFQAYPNPTSDKVSLYVEHNQKGTIEQAQIDIYDMRGGLVRSLTPTVTTDGYTVGPVLWNLCSNSGARVAPGVYLVRFLLTTDEGEKLCEHGKIIVK